MSFWSTLENLPNTGYDKYTIVKDKAMIAYDKKMANYDRWYRSFQSYSKDSLIKAIKDTTNPYEMRKAAHDVYEEKYGGDN